MQCELGENWVRRERMIRMQRWRRKKNEHCWKRRIIILDRIISLNSLLSSSSNSCNNNNHNKLRTINLHRISGSSHGVSISRSCRDSYLKIICRRNHRNWWMAVKKNKIRMGSSNNKNSNNHNRRRRQLIQDKDE